MEISHPGGPEVLKVATRPLPRLKADEVLLRVAAAGVTAIQIARALGNRVFVTAGSAEKCAACEALGAERAINYRTEDFVEVVKKLTPGQRVDVILDMVAGDYVPRELKCLADDGQAALHRAVHLQRRARAGSRPARAGRRRHEARSGGGARG